MAAWGTRRRLRPEILDTCRGRCIQLPCQPDRIWGIVRNLEVLLRLVAEGPNGDSIVFLFPTGDRRLRRPGGAHADTKANLRSRSSFPAIAGAATITHCTWHHQGVPQRFIHRESIAERNCRESQATTGPSQESAPGFAALVLARIREVIGFRFGTPLSRRFRSRHRFGIHRFGVDGAERARCGRLAILASRSGLVARWCARGSGES